MHFGACFPAIQVQSLTALIDGKEYARHAKYAKHDVSLFLIPSNPGLDQYLAGRQLRQGLHVPNEMPFDFDITGDIRNPAWLRC